MLVHQKNCQNSLEDIRITHMYSNILHMICSFAALFTYLAFRTTTILIGCG